MAEGSDPYGIFATGTTDDKVEYILTELMAPDNASRDKVPFKSGHSSPFLENFFYIKDYMEETGEGFPSMALDFQDVEKIQQQTRDFLGKQQDAVEGAMEKLEGTGAARSGGAGDRRRAQVIEEAKEGVKEQELSHGLDFQAQQSDVVTEATEWLLDAFPTEDLETYQTMKQKHKEWLGNRDPKLGQGKLYKWASRGFKKAHKTGKGAEDMDMYNNYIDKDTGQGI